MRRALLLLLLATSAEAAPRPTRRPSRPPRPRRPPLPRPPRTPGPHDAQATSLPREDQRRPDRGARSAAIAELTKIAATAIGAIDAWLARPHASSIEERRAVLDAINASVPDKTGKFKGPERQSGTERKADDDVDWPRQAARARSRAARRR